MSRPSRLSRPITAPVVIVLGALVAACGGAPPAATSAEASAAVVGTAVKPEFDLTLDGSVELPAYRSDAAAGLNSCAEATSGGWTYLYGGGSPLVTVTVSI